MEPDSLELEKILKMPAASPINTASIAAIIPAYNEEMSIEASIRSLLAQTRPPNAVFVIVNNSTDETYYLALPFVGAHQLIHREEHFTCVVEVIDIGVNADRKVGALNFGWTLAQDFDYLLGVDGDTVLDKHCLRGLVAEIVADSRLGGISAIYGFDQKAAHGANASFLIRSQRFQFAGFNLDNLLRSRNMAVLGGQCSLLNTSALKRTMLDNHQTTPWVTDSEIEDSLLSVQLKDSGFRTKISATSRADVGAMDTFRSLHAQQVKWNSGGVELMLQHPLHPNLRLRWRENVGMLTNLLSRVMFILLVAGALSIGVFSFLWWWLIPPMVSVLLNVRIGLAIKTHTWKDVAYALLFVPAEIYMALRGLHFIQAWAQVIGRQEHDNWAAQANAENGRAGSGKGIFVAIGVLAILAAVSYGWWHLSSIWQNGILGVGWIILAVLTIVQTILMLVKLFRSHHGYSA